MLKQVGQLGFPLLEVNDRVKPNETIAEVVKSKNTRLWEGFPIIFANSNNEGLFDFKIIKSLLKNKEDYNSFRQLSLMSIALYKFLNLKFSWQKNLVSNLSLDYKNEINEFLYCFRNNNDFKISQKYLNPQKIERLFENYFKSERPEVENIKNIHDELSLEYALSQIFTAKQKEIFLKRLQGKKLTKTEREYFYRVVKKKAMALANVDLQRLAQQVIR